MRPLAILRLGAILRLFAALLVLSTPAQANLADLLAWQKLSDSGAYVSSGFHDWRSVSKYRSHPGLHAGYDIAMLAGSAVRTPWEGSVVAITPWYGAEVGVTIRLSNGYQATFGHITASLQVGQSVRRGDIVGRVVVDHVDVKMRDLSGAHFDFAAEARLATRSVSRPPSREPLVTPEQRKAYKEAHARYESLLANLALQEQKIQAGILSQGVARESRAELARLRPLAARHGKLNPLTKLALPNLSSPGNESRRPVTDSLLQVAPDSSAPRGPALERGESPAPSERPE